MERKQSFLGRIVDIGAELFAMAAVCGRAQAERSIHPEGVELADLFCRQARLRSENLFEALWRNTDSADSAAAKRILAGRYAFLEEDVVTPPADLPWVADWSAGPSSTQDVRRRIPPA
jgi:hypothetical protein